MTSILTIILDLWYSGCMFSFGRNCAHVATEEHFDVIYAQFQENDVWGIYHSCGYLFIT